MAVIRFRSRHVHATVVDRLKLGLADLGWVNPPVNFGTQPVTILDYMPDERGTGIAQNTVAVSLGDLGSEEDEELGAKGGGLRSLDYPVFVDVYMSEQALSIAICDDIRDLFTDQIFPLVDQVTETPVVGTLIEIIQIFGPERPANNTGGEQFKRYWRTMRLDAQLYFNT